MCGVCAAPSVPDAYAGIEKGSVMLAILFFIFVIPVIPLVIKIVGGAILDMIDAAVRYWDAL